MSFTEKPESIDVRYVARLARMDLSAEEADSFQDQLDHILEHVRTLQTVDVEGVEPTAHAIPLHSVYREDAERPGLSREDVLANAPQERQHLFVVPRILE